jgi:DNA-binding transcriptional LysR family regulator
VHRHARNVELDWLRTFLAVLDRGGFTAASEQVHRSQSRVSAHVAALERELGVTLIDRSRRPARVTHAGEVLAGHAREILAAVGSARSAVGAARGLDEGRLTLLTTPCLGAAFLPGPLSRLAAARPEIRFTVLEDGRPDVERRFLDDGVAFAVLPALAAPAAPGLQERILWHEAVCALVPAAHPLATRLDPVSLRDLAREPLVLIGAPGEGVPEVVGLLARHGEVVIPTATADCPATVGALVRAGIGVGVLTGVAAHGAHVDGETVLLPLAEPGMVRRVSAYWYDALPGTELGRELLREVLAAPAPAGAVPVARASHEVRDVIPALPASGPIGSAAACSAGPVRE